MYILAYRQCILPPIFPASTCPWVNCNHQNNAQPNRHQPEEKSNICCDFLEEIIL